MNAPAETTQTIWQALDNWASSLKPWQRLILRLAIKERNLSDAQVDEVYDLFLQEAGLKDKKDVAEISVDVSGRPTGATTRLLRIDRIDGLVGVNALPADAALTFGPGLTIVYGPNGAGKSGFARLIANACFSRYKPSILGNVYAGTSTPSATAAFHVSIDGVAQQPIVFTKNIEHPELRRISFFDVVVAKHHVTEKSAFEFKPSGFDVFPEMARVYSQLAAKLERDVASRYRDMRFSESFIGLDTEVSKQVGAINAHSDIEALEKMAIYGPSESARFEEVDRQLTVLKSRSQKEHLETLKQAKEDLSAMSVKIAALKPQFEAAAISRRQEMRKKATEAAATAKALGAETFQRAFFKAVGSREWEAFAKSAHALARQEGSEYPMAGDRCILCEQPLDEESRAHVVALLSFVEGDAQRAATDAANDIANEKETVMEIDVALFAAGSRVREHVHKLDPSSEGVLADCAAAAGNAKEAALLALEDEKTVETPLDTGGEDAAITKLISTLSDDIARLEKEDVAAAIAALDLERQTLRHRMVLAQLLPGIKVYIGDTRWCEKAGRARSALNPRPVTDKERDLFGTLIGDSYRDRLADECRELGCLMPIELQTAGQKGKTVKSLSLGGYQPDAILSEGEQKAVDLADFLTEVGLGQENAAIVLDDPVTSQDHERKTLIAGRLIVETAKRQVIIFTHDLPFLNLLVLAAEEAGIDMQTHWIARNHDGAPGQITLNDAPATSKRYDTVERARECLAEAKATNGSASHAAVTQGMGALRRTIEETVVKRLLKGIVPRWQDRVIVTGLKKVHWDTELVDEMVQMYEDLSVYIEGHSHTDEAMGAPPEAKHLEQKIEAVNKLIKRARAERSTEVPAKSIAKA